MDDKKQEDVASGTSSSPNVSEPYLRRDHSKTLPTNFLGRKGSLGKIARETRKTLSTLSFKSRGFGTSMLSKQNLVELNVLSKSKRFIITIIEHYYRLYISYLFRFLPYLLTLTYDIS